MKLRTALATLPALVVASFASTAHAVTPIDFDVGNEHACIVSDCDMTQCWGGPNNTFGEAADRAGEAFEVAVGMDHTCTLDGSGVATCWGRNDPVFGVLDAPKTEFLDIEAGNFHTCGIRRSDRGIECWGWDRGHDADPEDDDLGDTVVSGVRPMTAYRQLDAGYDYSCAVTTGQNAIDCWGLDVPGAVRRLLSWDVLRDHGTPIANPERFVEVAVGYTHFCFTTTYGAVYCVGNNNDAGQLSPFYEKDPKTPVGEVVELIDHENPQDSELDDNAWWWFWPTIHRQTGRVYVGVGASMLGTCALYRENSGRVENWCWGYPFDYGWGTSLPLAIEPEQLRMSAHNYCASNSTTGEVDCVAEFRSSTLDEVEELLTCE